LDFILGAIGFEALSGTGLTWSLAFNGLLVCSLTHWLIGGAIKAVLGKR
jgi:hypothetical protein